MYLWRNLPEGQLLAVLRWMTSRRERQAATDRLASEASTTAPDAAAKPIAPAR